MLLLCYSAVLDLSQGLNLIHTHFWQPLTVAWLILQSLPTDAVLFFVFFHSLSHWTKQQKGVVHNDGVIRDTPRWASNWKWERDSGLMCIDLNFQSPLCPFQVCSRSSGWLLSAGNHRMLSLRFKIQSVLNILAYALCFFSSSTKYLPAKRTTYKATFFNTLFCQHGGSFFIYLFIFLPLCTVLCKHFLDDSFPSKSHLATQWKEWLVRGSAEHLPPAWPVVRGFNPKRMTG